jgi:large subunit ribosomal protein L4
MKTILSLQAQNDRLTVVEDFSIESGKTKDLVKVLDSLAKNAPVKFEPVLRTGAGKTHQKKGDKAEDYRTVILLKDDDKLIKQAGRNLPYVSFLSFNRLRAHDLFYARKIVMLEGAAKNLSEFFEKVEAE